MIAPKLRFSEFKDEWFETTLNNLLKLRTANSLKLGKSRLISRN